MEIFIDAPVKDFADIPITNFLLADTDNRCDNKITWLKDHMITL